MKKIIAIGVLAIGCSSLFAAAPAATNAPGKSEPKAQAGATNANDEVIVKGKGIQIKRSELEEAMATIKSSARGQQLPPDQLESIKPQMLDRLIAMKLLTAQATDADKTKAKEKTDKRVAEITKSAGGMDKLEAQLKMHGISMDEFRSKLGEESVAEAVMERETKLEVTDAEAKKFYEDNPSRFEQPEMARASHILLMTQDEQGKPLPEEKKQEKKKQIEDILKKARAGEDFAKLAKEYSEDPGSKDRGGEYTFPRGQMVPEFEKAAFSMKTNEVSDVITTQYGYHIIKLHEIIPAKKVPFVDVEAKIKEALMAQKLQSAMPDLLGRLKKEANVQVLDESLKPKPETNAVPAAPEKPATPAPEKKAPKKK